MVEDTNYKSLSLYLMLKEIKIVEEINNKTYKDPAAIELLDIKNQINNINEFHKKAMGYKVCFNERISTSIGRDVECYKINIKKLRRELKNLEGKNDRNRFEEILMEKGYLYLNRSEKCIEQINNSTYIELITRSMNREEICLGDTWFSNLGKQGNIEIVSLNKCCYNMVEMDGVYFLSALKRKNINIDFREIIKLFCTLEELDEHSEKFIEAMISYPYDFMKCFNRYREKKKQWNEEEYIEKLEKAIMKDGQSLI